MENKTYFRDNELNALRRMKIHEGKGEIDVKFFARPDDAATGWPSAPALLMTYTIPPGASEGMHTHRTGDKDEGAFDEFYYVVEGRGIMQIEDEVIDLKAGDFIFTPNGVAHGIENNASSGNLKIFLTAVERDGRILPPSPAR